MACGSVIPLIESCIATPPTGGSRLITTSAIVTKHPFLKISFLSWIVLALSHSLLRWLSALQYIQINLLPSLLLASKPLMWWWFTSFSILSLPATSSISSGFLMVYFLSSVSSLSKFHPFQSTYVLIRSVLMGPNFFNICQTSISAVSSFPSVFSELTLMFRNL